MLFAQSAEAGWTTIMSEGFEGAFPSGTWTVNGDPTWGADDFKPHTGLKSAWCANGGSAGLDPASDNYPNNMNAWMIYGPFDLSEASGAEVLCNFWLESQFDLDNLDFGASINGFNFFGTRVTGNSSGWQQYTLDLTRIDALGNPCGRSQVWIAFIFKSDSSGTYKGAFIDNIVLQMYRAPLPAAERQALIALYESTHGDTWYDNSGWKTPPLDTDGFAMPGTESDWYGVTCSGATATQIDLTANNLRGRLPAELMNLTNLTTLNICDNHLFTNDATLQTFLDAKAPGWKSCQIPLCSPGIHLLLLGD